MKTISVTEPLTHAMNHVKAVLFQPFDAAKWFIIGFCAWLAYLGQGGGSFGNYNFGRHSGPGGARESLERAREFIVHNLTWLVPLAIGIFVVLLAIALVMLWLSSRGQFMFLHCVSKNVAAVSEPWKDYATEANSLFVFRVVVALLGLILFLPLGIGLALTIMGMILHENFALGGILIAVLIVFVMCVVGVLFWILTRVLEDFIIPIQYRRRIGIMQAWGEFRKLLSGHVADFSIYLLFRIVLSIGIAAVVFAAVIVTCCILGCLMAVPYLGTVILLPVLVLERSYSLYYLAQYGPAYDCMPVMVLPGSQSAAGPQSQL